MTRRRPTPSRAVQLRALLEQRRQELNGDVNGRVRDVRTRARDAHDLTDIDDGADGDIQEDIDLVLIQIKAETVGRIDAALRRLEAGVYGDCSQCDAPIAAERLRAMPFAVRCTECEASRERDSAANRHVHAAYRDPSRDLVD